MNDGHNSDFHKGFVAGTVASSTNWETDKTILDLDIFDIFKVSYF